MSGQPNTRLADLFGLAGWSKGELARLVNRQAAAMGHPQLATDTSRVRRWIDMGEIPRDPVPRVLAALFTERLGRVVTIEDLGLVRHGRTGRRQDGGNVEHPDGVPWAPERTAAVLTEFTGMDLMLNRRGLVGAGVALTAGSALSSAMHDWLHTDPALAADAPDLDNPLHADPAGFDRYEAAPIGAQEIEELERSVEVFRAWDAARGGGLQRKAVVGQLNEVGGMLSYRHPEHLQRRLWGVAANLAVLAGWMSHDIGLEPTAQKYFIIAAHAAREGGDRPRAGEALSRAARQLVHLGKPDEALDLMKLAQSGSGEQVLPRTKAMLHTVEAWAQASLGKGQAMRRTLGQAEDLFVSDRGTFRRPAGCRCSRRRISTACRPWPTARSRSTNRPRPSRPSTMRRRLWNCASTSKQRSKIFDFLSMASASFIADDPEQAASYARLALAAMGSNSSHRTWDRLREMYRLTGQYSSYPKIQDLREEIKLALPKTQPKNKGDIASA